MSLTANSARYQELINEKQAFINNNPDKVKAYDDKVKALVRCPTRHCQISSNSKENSSNSLDSANPELGRPNWTKRKAPAGCGDSIPEDQLLTGYFQWN